MTNESDRDLVGRVARGDRAAVRLCSCAITRGSTASWRARRWPPTRRCGRRQDRVPNHVYDLQQAPAVVNYAFQRIALDSGAASGKDVRIAVIDTAVDETHPALKGVVAEIFDAMPDVEITARDHGTSVA